MAKRVVVQFKMKTIKRYGVPGFLSMLLMLVFIALPIVECFMPLFGGVKSAIGIGDEPFQATMIDIVKFGFHMDDGALLKLFQDPTGGLYPGYKADYYTMYQTAVPIFMYIFMGLFFAQVLGAIIALILFLAFLFKGRWNHFKEPHACAHFSFWMTFLLSSGVQILIVFSTIMCTGGYGNVKNGYMLFNFPGWLYSLCYFGAAFVAMLLVSLFYEYGLADRIYVGKNRRASEPEIRAVEAPQPEEVAPEVPETTPEAPEEPKVEEKPKEEIIGTTIPPVIPQVEPEPQKGLPQDVPSIGGHAFAENQNVIIADIPDHIEKLGDAAFSNCLNLETVKLHKNIKSIGSNCFFNCARLKRINYEGTKQEWKNIKRGSNWLLKAGTKVVYCSDGPIQVNPFH